MVGRSIAEIARDVRFPKDSLIIGYQSLSQDNLMIPNGSTVMEPNSTVLIVTKPGQIHQVIDFIQGSL